jgi:ABC-type branched-subunit amino acid transport system ATPase component
MLTIRNLYAGYSKENPILKGINLTVDNGDIIGILGRNGSGKSTLAKAICGLVPYVKGEIQLDGIPISGLPTYVIAKLGIGFFQQGGRIFPNLSVYENIAFAAGSLSKNEMDARLQEISVWFKLLQNSDRLKINASYLSGGEKHQLALAMVLIQKPNFLILDEPSAGLSPGNQKVLYESLNEIKRTTKLTQLIIEQNIGFAEEFCENLVILQNGVVK